MGERERYIDRNQNRRSERDDRRERDSRTHYREEKSSYSRNDDKYWKKDSRDNRSSRYTRERRATREDDDYPDRHRRRRDDRYREPHSESISSDKHREERREEPVSERNVKHSKPRPSGKVKIRSSENLQMFPFIDPEKAAILAGNTLLPYAISIKNRVYIGNMGPDITPEDLRSALTPFGVVVNVGMGRFPEVRESDPEGVSKGFCFVDFSDADSAEKLLNVDPPVIRIFGRLLRVVEPRFHLDNIEKERFMSVESAALLVQAGIIELVETSGEVASTAESLGASKTE